MRARTIPVKAIHAGGRGPGKYFFSKRDSRGHLRNTKPQLLFGTPPLFQRCVERSGLSHPYTSYIISYKGEVTPPSPDVRKEIRRTFFRLLCAGIREDRVLALGVDHGEDEHGALLRHVVAPNWPSFQPYYHQADKYCFSAFEWLTNRCYGLRAPEDPANTQLVSLAGKHFDERHIVVLERLRSLIQEELLRHDGLKSHEAFLTLLNQAGYRADVVEHPNAMDVDELDREDSRKRRVWLEIQKDEDLTILLKGPVCQPGFLREQYERRCQEKSNAYQGFLQNPYPLWESFLRGVGYRNERNRKRFPAFCEDFERLEHLGFASLHPDRSGFGIS